MINYQVLKQAIKDNPEEFTINQRGLYYKPSAGYAVSVTNNTFKSITAVTAKKLIKQAKSLNIKDYYIGGWKNSAGKYFLDVTIIVTNKKLHWQLAGCLTNRPFIILKLIKLLYAKYHQNKRCWQVGWRQRR